MGFLALESTGSLPMTVAVLASSAASHASIVALGAPSGISGRAAMRGEPALAVRAGSRAIHSATTTARLFISRRERSGTRRLFLRLTGSG